MGLDQAGGKLPLFDTNGKRYDERTIRRCIDRTGWAEPWFENPLKPDWLVVAFEGDGETGPSAWIWRARTGSASGPWRRALLTCNYPTGRRGRTGGAPGHQPVRHLFLVAIARRLLSVHRGRQHEGRTGPRSERR